MTSVDMQSTVSSKVFAQFMGDLGKQDLTREIEESEISTNTKWRMFRVQIPGYCANLRVGPCLIIGAAAPVNNQPSAEYLVRPVTAYGDAERLKRHKILAVPSRILPRFSGIPLNYVTLLNSIIVDFTPMTSDIDNSLVKLYEFTPHTDETTFDKGRITEMTLKELNLRIQSGNTDDDTALSILENANPELSSSLMLRAEHIRSCSVDRYTILPDRIGSCLAASHTSDSFTISIDEDLLMPPYIRVSVGRVSGVRASFKWLDSLFSQRSSESRETAPKKL